MTSSLCNSRKWPKYPSVGYPGVQETLEEIGRTQMIYGKENSSSLTLGNY